MRPIRVFGLIVAAWTLGVAAPQAEGKGAVTITFKTNPTPNLEFSPQNVVAVWIEQGGTFVKTVGTWVAVRQEYLRAWNAASLGSTVDAISNASRNDHATPLTITWNLRDLQGRTVPDGTYTIRLEVAESNAANPAQNNQGTFTFAKDVMPQLQTNQSNGGFTNVTIDFDPNAITCADGLVDAPEKCDRAIAEGMMGACPTTCAVEDACVPVTLQGSAAQCTAECVI